MINARYVLAPDVAACAVPGIDELADHVTRKISAALLQHGGAPGTIAHRWWAEVWVAPEDNPDGRWNVLQEDWAPGDPVPQHTFQLVYQGWARVPG